MKIKELIKNKWGWTLAAVSLVYIVLSVGINSLFSFSYCSSPFICAPTSLFIVIGFILGLILEKIYRRII